MTHSNDTLESLSLAAATCWYQERARFLDTPEERKILADRAICTLATILGSSWSRAASLMLRSGAVS